MILKGIIPRLLSVHLFGMHVGLIYLFLSCDFDDKNDFVGFKYLDVLRHAWQLNLTISIQYVMYICIYIYIYIYEFCGLFVKT